MAQKPEVKFDKLFPKLYNTELWLMAYERIGSTDKELVTLRNSGHCLTVDSEWEAVAEKSYEFIREHLLADVRIGG